MSQSTSALHLELFDPERPLIFEKLAVFRKLGILAEGTALMLQIGHRKSFDFDIFTSIELPENLLRKVNTMFSGSAIFSSIDTKENLTLTVDSIVLTFFYHPFPPLYPHITTSSLSLFNINDIASNKAYTIGRRPAWRDYVDLYFLLRDHTTIEKIISDTQKRFAGNFSEKLFLEQLTFFDDLEERTMNLIGKTITENNIKSLLIEKAKEYLHKI